VARKEEGEREEEKEREKKYIHDKANKAKC
jgi:hypothetical protein